MSSVDNYGGHDRRHEIVQNTIPAMVLAIFTVAARFASRRIQRGGIEWHDWFVVLGLVGSLFQSALVLDSAAQGIGLHINLVSAENLRMIFILEYIAKIDYALTFTFIKISILLLYRAIFAGRGFAIATNIVMGYVVSWGVAVVLVSIFSCNPVRGFWDVDISSTCVSSISFFEWTTLTNVLGDIFILALPIRRVWNLQMNKQKKIAVSAMFLLGGLVVLSTVIRLIFMMQMDVTDATWTYVQPAIWFTVELNVAVISACLPTLRPLVQRLWPTALATTISSLWSRHTASRNTSKNKSKQSSEKAWKASQNSDTTTASHTPDIHALNSSDTQDSETQRDFPKTFLSFPSTASLPPTAIGTAITSTSIDAEHSFSPNTSYFPFNSPTVSPILPPKTPNFPSPPSSGPFSRFSRPRTPKTPIRTPANLNFSVSPVTPRSISTYHTQPELEPFTHSSIASIPMPPASIPMPAPSPACFQPEDLERHLAPPADAAFSSSGGAGSWARYAISDAGITDTGDLGIDFAEGFGGAIRDEVRGGEGMEVVCEAEESFVNERR